MRKPSPSLLLSVVVAGVLTASLPSAIHRIIVTRDLYLFTDQFFQDILARLSGPGRLRFVIQPLVAIILGVRSGIGDARLGNAPFLWALMFHPLHRGELLKSALKAIEKLVAIAILADITSQYLIFHNVRPGAALLLGPVLITLPYVIARAFSNRIARRFRVLPTPRTGARA